MTFEKTIKTREEAYLEFSEEEIKQLGIQKGDKFTWKIKGDGVFLEKWKKVDIDFNEFSKEELISLINYSVENDYTIGKSINDILKEYLDNQG